MKCRFAPSPTGLLHVGNARSAVLNWAYAKKNNGNFILRIDDTDQVRSSKEFENKIKENLSYNILNKYNLIDRYKAIVNIHFPESQELLSGSTKRLKFEELFFNQLGFQLSKNERIQKLNGFKFEKVGDHLNEFYKNNLPFKLTGDQKKVIKEIIAAAKKSKNLYLATDPDREGEAIAWHVEKLLRENASLSKLNIHRVTFNEITKNAVLDSLKEPRKVDEDLINAYLARRALDFLVGFNLSPVLWRKLPGSKSAGRVQSVALRIISEREL